MQHLRLGEILIERGYMQIADVEAVLSAQGRLGED